MADEALPFKLKPANNSEFACLGTASARESLTVLTTAALFEILNVALSETCVNALTNPNFASNGSQVARLKVVAALLTFLVVGFIFAAPCLCDTGAVRRRFTMAFFALAVVRLAWAACKCTFCFKDYFFYLAAVILFSIWANFTAED